MTMKFPGLSIHTGRVLTALIRLHHTVSYAYGI